MMIGEAPEPALTADKIRERRRILLGLFLTIFIGMCVGTYYTWGDASGHTRFEAKVAVAVILGLLFPVSTAVMLRGVHTRPIRERPRRKGPSSVAIFAVFVLAPLLQANPPWEPVFFVASAAFTFGFCIAMGVLFLVVSPEEEAARRQEVDLG